MDITTCALITLGSVILLLAMWACASSDVNQWGPDLTSELPPHLLREVFFHDECKKKETSNGTVPSAPSELPGAPLLTNAQPMGVRRPAPPPPPTYKSSNSTKFLPVRVLPREFVPREKLRPTAFNFQNEVKT